MAQTTILPLLSQTPYSSANTTVRGAKQPAAAYYLANSDLQTVSWSTNNFSGTITIQASLVTSPNENNDNDWFDVHSVAYSATSIIDYSNVSGNFVWIRAKISGFTQGVVQYIKVSY